MSHYPHLTPVLVDELALIGIHRNSAQVDHAIDGAIDTFETNEGTRVDSYNFNDRTWHEILHMPFGVYDLLEIDSEDTLYDRLEGEDL